MRVWSSLAGVFPRNRTVRKQASQSLDSRRRRAGGLRSEPLEPRRMLTHADVIGDTFYDNHDYEGLFSESLVGLDASGDESTVSHDGDGSGGGCPVCGAAFCVMHLDKQGNTYAELSAIPDTAAISPDAFDEVPAQAPLADTFFLHSRPGASKKIYLDFDGHVTTGTSWKSGATITTPAYNVDGVAGFSDTELQNIQNIWARIVENFSPFDVDVTTEEPSVDDLRKSGSGDQRWGIRVVIGKNNWGSGGAGVAYLGSFSWSSDTPCFVFPELLGYSNKSIAMATSHEVGHALGLSHDGGGGDGAYYGGHGSGTTSWGPIMGAPYGKNVLHWSKGEYKDANNQQDDLAIIVGAVTTDYTRNGNGFGYRADDFGNSIETAHQPTFSDDFVSSATVSGVVERFSDIDVFEFFTGETLQATINPSAVGPSLDVLAKILDPSGTVLFQSNPIESLSASFTQTLAAGYYYLTVEGTGKGDVLGNGYSDYGSLGQYTVSLTVSGADGPEIQVLDGGANVADGTGAVNLGATPIGSPVTKTFTVRNIGTSDLVVQPITVPTGFTVTTNLAADEVIPAGSSTTFVVQLDAAAIGTYSGTLSFSNTDGNEDPFDFTISGTVDPPPAPEIEVRVGPNGIADGTGSVDFGRIPVGGSPIKVFTVKNIGNLDLVVEPVTVPAGFKLVQDFTAGQVIAAGQEATFKVQYEAAIAGTASGTVSFITSDADENPFDFSITAEAYVPPNVQFIDDGDLGFATTGRWGHGTRSGNLGDHHFSAAGQGNDRATWTFAVSPGLYRVSATWTGGWRRATDSPFTVVDGERLLSTVDMNQERNPSDFYVEHADRKVWYEDIGGPYAIKSTLLTVSLSDEANQYVIADSIRIERLGDVPADSPEIEVLLDPQGPLQNPSRIADGQGHVEFGQTVPGTPVNRSFTVRNTGDANLTVDHITVPDGFSVVSGFSDGDVIQPGETGAFVLRLDATVGGSFEGTVSFGTSDADESPFDFTVSGMVTQPSPLQIIDNGAPGFSSTGAWRLGVRSGYEGDHQFNAAGIGDDTATWAFNVVPGEYRVSVTWTAGRNRASDAAFTVADGAEVLETVYVNQKLAPDDFKSDGARWEDLGGTYTISGNRLVVTLSDDANHYVIADAVRVERVISPPDAAEIQVFVGGEAIQDNSGVVPFGKTRPGDVVIKTFTVKNNGTDSLTLQPVTVPDGFTVTSNLGANSVLAAGESTTFVVQLNAVYEGEYSGTLQFVNTDGDENPFDFTITGVVVEPAVVQVIDDGGEGFATTGLWGVGARSGFLGDHRYSAAGSGNATATWTFDVTPGEYRVSARWNAGRNRATNSPFTVSDGGTPFLTVYVNQERAPDDFYVAGRGWENIGGAYSISGTTLVVTLSDAADQYVVADAVRIERIGDVAPLVGDIEVVDGLGDASAGSGMTVSGVVGELPAVQVMNDGDSGFETVGIWGVGTHSGFQGEHHYSAAGSGSSASWTFSITPGEYRVSASWQGGENRSTQSSFTIADDENLISAVHVNQRQDPNDYSSAGLRWKDLGSSVTVTGSTIVVTLADSPDGYVVADAVRIERIGRLPV